MLSFRQNWNWATEQSKSGDELKLSFEQRTSVEGTAEEWLYVKDL